MPDYFKELKFPIYYLGIQKGKLIKREYKKAIIGTTYLQLKDEEGVMAYVKKESLGILNSKGNYSIYLTEKPDQAMVEKFINESIAVESMKIAVLEKQINNAKEKIETFNKLIEG